METFLKDPVIEYIGSSEKMADPNGMLLIFEPYEDHSHYYLGVDTGAGVGQSNSVIEVIREGTKQRPESQSAEYACNFMGPAEFATVVNKVGNMFYDKMMDMPAVAVVENNNFGQLCLHVLLEELSYPNVFQDTDTLKEGRPLITKLGINTHSTSRPKFVMLGENRIKTGQLTVNSPYLLDEMMEFELVDLKNISALNEEMVADAGKFKGKKKDDRLIATFLALWGINEVRPDIALERERFKTKQFKADTAPVKRDYRNTDCTFEQMVREQDELF